MRKNEITVGGLYETVRGMVRVDRIRTEATTGAIRSRTVYNVTYTGSGEKDVFGSAGKFSGVHIPMVLEVATVLPPEPEGEQLDE